MQLATTLVEERLAACTNLIPALTSVYRWQDQVESSEEILLLIKTRKDCYARLEDRIKSLHPYELPEILSVPVENGLPDYLDWIDNCTGKLE